jgi:Xaa-Pro aminopeptidase
VDKARNQLPYLPKHSESLSKNRRTVTGHLSQNRSKNATEIAGYKKAMVKDGVAMVRFWKWMEQALADGLSFDEMDVADKLVEFRSSDSQYVSESFAPIVGYNGNGAIVHYSATPASKTLIKPDGFLLIDTGGQWYDGTTDITRSFSLYRGDTPEEYKKDYAAVLKGNIALAECVFPENLRGCLIDAFARQFIWQRGCQYGHGTCHGIGHFLNVHEGPQSIRMEENPVTIKAGMVMSNEPGIYRTGQYGLRVENVMLCYEKMKTEAGTFLSFETLTLFPLDLKSINPAYYSPAEIAWINRYHKKVYDSLSPYLNEEEKSWLKEKTKAL